MAKKARNKEQEIAARGDAELNSLTSAYDELLARVMDAKAVAENPASVTWFLARSNKVDDAIAAYKEASKLKSLSIETEDDISTHIKATNDLKSAVKDMAAYTIDYRIVCGDLSEFLKKHPLFCSELPRSAEWNQNTGLIDIIQNKGE